MSQYGRYGPGSYASRSYVEHHRSEPSDSILARQYNAQLERDRDSRPQPRLTAECTASYTRFDHCGHSTDNRTQRVAGCWQCALMAPYQCTPTPIRIRVAGRCASCNADNRDHRGRYMPANADRHRDGLSRYVSEYGRQGAGGIGYHERSYYGGGSSSSQPSSNTHYSSSRTSSRSGPSSYGRYGSRR